MGCVQSKCTCDVSVGEKEFIRTGMKAIIKREKTVEKRESAVEKRENEVEKTVATQKKAGDRLAMEQVGLEKAQMQVKRDGESVFERETKLWQDKKELANDRCKFDAKVHQSRKDIKREKEKFASEMIWMERKLILRMRTNEKAENMEMQ